MTQITKLVNTYLNNSLVRTTGIIFLATFIGSLIAFLANFYISNHIGPEKFGNFKTIIYLFTFLPALANLGIQAALPKYIAEFRVRNKERIGHFVMWFVKIRLIIFLVLGLLLFLLSSKISLYLFSTEQYSNLVLAGLLIFFALYFAMFPYIVQGYQNFRLIAVSMFLGYALPPLVSIFLIPFNLVYMIMGFGLSMALSYIITIGFLIKQKTFSSPIHFKMDRIIQSFILPMHWLFLVMALPSLAVPFFSLFFAQDVIGYFSYSVMFYTAAILIPGIISYIVLPKTSELNSMKKHVEARNLIKKAFILYTPVVIIGTIGVLLLSNLFLNLVSPQYLPGATIFKSIIIFGLFSGYGLIYSSYLQGIGNVKKTAIIILLLNISLFLISGLILSSM